MNGLIEKIVYPGRRLIRIQGKVIFTDLGLPGELVQVVPFRERKSYAEARTVKIIEPSLRRVAPRCRHYRVCSPYQEMDYGLQLEIKKAQIEEILAPVLHHPRPSIPIIPSPEKWGYRTKITLRLFWEERGPSLAYYEPGETNFFVPVDRCALVPDDINDFAAGLRDLAATGNSKSLNEIEIRLSRSSGRFLAVLKADSVRDLGDMAVSIPGLPAAAGLAGVVALIEKNGRRRKTILTGQEYLEEKIGGLTFSYGACSFFQVNLGMLEVLINDVKSALSELSHPEVADLYCGVGTFGLSVSVSSAQVIGVESDPENLRYLRKNVDLNGIRNFRVCQGKSENRIISILDRRPQVVVLDPPRRGLAPSLVSALSAKPVRKIIYVSCNPSTLARDLARLSAVYAPEAIRAYDFFPHTPHIETMAVLSKRQRR